MIIIPSPEIYKIILKTVELDWNFFITNNLLVSIIIHRLMLIPCYKRNSQISCSISVVKSKVIKVSAFVPHSMVM